jgi:hypothetical protein
MDIFRLLLLDAVAWLTIMMMMMKVDFKVRSVGRLSQSNNNGQCKESGKRILLEGVGDDVQTVSNSRDFPWFRLIVIENLHRDREK